jgi:TrmH family RNA methyltransferase
MPLSEQIMDNPHADRVKRIAALRLASVRQRQGRFLIEGPQAVREAVTCMPSLVTDIYVDTQADPNADIVDAALGADGQGGHRIYIHKVTGRVLDHISPDAQSIAAIGMSAPMEKTISDLSDLSHTSNHLLVAACWQVRDPGNEGTLIRTADAAGFDALVLVDRCVHPLNTKVIRATAGSLFHIPVISASTDEFFAWADSAQARVWAADIHGTPDQAPYDLATLVQSGTGMRPEDGSLALLFGNEARGLPTQIVQRADASVKIPIYGQAESLNLAMSGAVLMYTVAMAEHSDSTEA